MVIALWVVKRSFAENNPEMTELICSTLQESKKSGIYHYNELVTKAEIRTGLPLKVIEDCFMNIWVDFDEDYRRSLLVFFDYAYKSGLIDERVKLHVWGEDKSK